MSKYDEVLIDTAILWSKQSYCNRRKVGAILAKDNRILSCGYNGTINGFHNDCEDELNKTKECVLHAEQNALMYCAKYGLSTKDTTLYITVAPCVNCAKLIIQAGIKRIVYLEDYTFNCGINLLKKANIKVNKFIRSKVCKKI